MDEHVPVLLAPAVELLAPSLEAGGWLIDCTVGLGGHAEACLERLPDASLLAIDRDPEALRQARARLERFGARVRFALGPFSDLETAVRSAGLPDSGPGIRGLLADLGVSSMQLDRADRGFSFTRDGPLDMRMAGADSDAPTAADVVNTYSEDALTRIIKQYGEEPRARRIARALVEDRQEQPFRTTGQLARLVERLKPARRDRGRRGSGRRIHPATQTFQALRIEVNQELDELSQLIDQSVRMLEQDGRLVVISYHSLEDRIVKHSLRDLATGEIEPITGRTRAETQVIEVLTKKPIRPSDDEVAANPRARSARLRAARRL